MIHLYIFNEGTRAAAYGIGTYIRQLTECLKNNKDFSLTVIQLYCTDIKEFTIKEDKSIRTILFPGTKLPSPQTIEKYYNNAWHLIRMNIQDIKDDDKLIFHLNYHTEYPIIKKIKSDFPNCKIIYTIHYQEWVFKLKGNTSSFKRIIHSIKSDLKNEEEMQIYRSFEQEKALFTKVDKIVCLADYTKNLLTEEYKVPEDKIVRIYNGLKDEGILLTKQEKYELKKSLGFSENEQILLFVGRIEETKGIDIIIKTFNQIVKDGSDCRLVIAGEGVFSNYMEQIKDCWGKITFTGQLKKKDLYKFYQIADLGIMPSMHEQCSYVAIEMMMFGILTIATATAGLNEMITDGVNGYKIPITEKEKDVEISSTHIKKEICNALSNKNRFDKNAIRDIFAKKYLLKSMKTNYLILYRSIV